MRRQPRPWPEIINQLESSGLSIKEFAQREGYSKSSLYLHRKKLRETQPHPPQIISFEIRPPTPTPTAPLEIATLSIGEVKLSLNELPHPLWLATVMKELKR